MITMSCTQSSKQHNNVFVQLFKNAKKNQKKNVEQREKKKLPVNYTFLLQDSEIIPEGQAITMVLTMVAQDMLRKYEVGLFREKNGFDDSFDVNKCLQQIEIPDLLLMCAPISGLPIYKQLRPLWDGVPGNQGVRYLTRTHSPNKSISNSYLDSL